MDIESIVEQVYDNCGMVDPSDLPIEDVIGSYNIHIKEEHIDGSDGRIIPTSNSAILTLNSNIKVHTRRKFVLAHELGHFIMHRNNGKMFQDDTSTLNSWYDNNYNKAEIEANMFAAEFLMPKWIFEDECKGKKFSPELIDELAEGFEVSKTAAILRFVECGHYPVCIVYCHDNKMKWFKRSKDFRHYVEYERNLPPRYGTVAEELFTTNTIYKGKDRKQTISKSAWFKPNKYDDGDTDYNEYCLFVPKYNYSISVLWED